MWRSTRRTSPGGGGLLEPQDALDLGEFGIGVLQRSRSTHDHVHSDSVAGRHLVHKAAEIELELGHACSQLVAPAPQIDISLLARR